MPPENLTKLRELADWLIARGDRLNHGDWILDADYMCLPADAVDAHRGDLGGLVVTEYLRIMTARELAKSEYVARDVQVAWINVFGARGELYESLVNVDEVLSDYAALHDKIALCDYGTTLKKYLDRGVRGEVSWAWYIKRLDEDTGH